MAGLPSWQREKLCQCCTHRGALDLSSRDTFAETKAAAVSLHRASPPPVLRTLLSAVLERRLADSGSRPASAATHHCSAESSRSHDVYVCLNTTTMCLLFRFDPVVPLKVVLPAVV